MSINKKQVSKVKGNRALQLFIDRHHSIKNCAEYINNALQRLGDLQAGLSQQEEAIKNFQAALAEFNRSL